MRVIAYGLLYNSLHGKTLEYAGRRVESVSAAASVNRH